MALPFMKYRILYDKLVIAREKKIKINLF